METRKIKFTLFEKIFYTLGVISGCLFCVGILFACTLEGLCKTVDLNALEEKLMLPFFNLATYCVTTPDRRRSNSE